MKDRKKQLLDFKLIKSIKGEPFGSPFCLFAVKDLIEGNYEKIAAMKFEYSISFTFAVFISGCTINVNQPNTGTANNVNSLVSTATTKAVNQSPWSTVICSSRANSVTLSAGASETAGEVFATWKQESSQHTFELPAKLQSFSCVHLKASAFDKNQVKCAFFLIGKAEKQIEGDEDEDVFVI